MKTNILFLASLFCCSGLYAATASTVEAVPRHATVFLSGAEVEQQARLSLHKGANEVRVEGIAPFTDPAGIQISLSDGVVVSSFEYANDYLHAGRENATARQLRDSITLYQNRLKTTESQLEATRQMKQLLQDGVSNALRGEKQAVSSQLIEQQLAYYQRRVLQLSEQEVAADREREQLQTRITALQKQLQQDGTLSAKRSGVITLNLVAPKACTATADIRYFTDYAGWAPVYDLNIASTESPVALALRARVQQRTGLDWNNIRLTLSTGSPTHSSQVPEFSTWFLRQQQLYRNERSAYAVRPLLAKVAVTEDMVMEEDEGADAVIADYVKTNEQALSLEYAIELPYTILGNGKEQTVALEQQTIQEPVFRYYTAPKLDGSVFLTMDIADRAQYRLLDATANITYAGTYYGTTFLNASSTDEQLRLTIGDEKQIVTKRERLAGKSKTSGGNKTVTTTYRITVRNNLRREATITLQEPYPVSTAKEISVSLDSNTTRWSTNDAERGLLTYDLTLQPDESRDILVSYTVKYPKDWTINL